MLYEYKCPYCGRKNIRFGEYGRIVCDYCKKEFTPIKYYIQPATNTTSDKIDLFNSSSNSDVELDLVRIRELINGQDT